MWGADVSDDGVYHLYVAVALQQALYGLGWAAGARLLPASRPAMRAWAAFSLCTAAGLGLAVMRPLLPPWVGVVGANVFLLLPFVLVWRAVELFFGLPPHRGWQGALALGLLATLVYLGPAPEQSTTRAWVMLLAIGGIIGAAALRSHGPMRHEFGPVVAWVVHLPGLLAALVLLAVLAGVAASPHRHLQDLASLDLALPLGYGMLLACNGIHLAYGGMQLTRLARRLLHLSRHDGLTGLLNRRAMHDVLQDEWQRHLRLGSGFALLMLDLDHFKQVNDRWGHHAGDLALVHTARLLDRQLRPTDRASRHGGEEFLLLLPGVDGLTALQVAERLRQQLQADPVALDDGMRLGLTVSIGVAGLAPGDDGVAALLRRADAALYQAKADGRNQVSLAPDPPPPPQGPPNRQRLAQGSRRARADEF
ncbi:GGDEF domain-containing protein [Ideonella livida]|uniref:diguanylate cyclase n=1 Tax=Ideonella livida TaxID=2707176 RepID=A0A7C9TGQ0_9BURK|nr:GGDEF domain-containing protein [Ideonella livida]NDY89820.1 GGDEF domain-containing protein [Ideonella livida]